MDALHHDCVEILVRLGTMVDREFHEGYAQLLHKVERTFRTEEQWMEAIDFPELRHHREQHANLLGVLYHGQAKVMAGNLQVGRDIVEKLLPEWLHFHASTMDSTLANQLRLSAQTG